jgi:hypothetical protein
MARDADPTDLLADLDSSSNAVLSARSKARIKTVDPAPDGQLPDGQLSIQRHGIRHPDRREDTPSLHEENLPMNREEFRPPR